MGGGGYHASMGIRCAQCGVCLGERDSGGSEVGDVLGQQGVVVIVHKDTMGIRDSGRTEVGQGGFVGTAGGDGHRAQGQYGDQCVHSGGGGVCLSCLGQMGAMQSLAIVAYTVGVSYGDVGFCMDSWISFIFVI